MHAKRPTQETAVTPGPPVPNEPGSLNPRQLVPFQITAVSAAAATQKEGLVQDTVLSPVPDGLPDGCQLVPFHTSAMDAGLPEGEVNMAPAAMHQVGLAQDTSDTAPAGRPGAWCHAVPFHTTESPSTKARHVRPRQDTASGKVSAPGFPARGVTRHPIPFHASASVAELLITPTAMQRAREAQDTSGSTLSRAREAGRRRHDEPFQDSVSATNLP